MKVVQLSTFIENRMGAVKGPLEALANAKIDVATLALADTSEFGILRLVVKDHDAAKRVLEGAGYVVNVAELLPVEVEDKAGALAAVLERVDRAGLAIEYLYAFGAPPTPGRAVLLFRYDDPVAARRALTSWGVKVLSADELFVRR
jgi:hypothetical protein